VLDTLPYLADYPYGCVEQTMSRFLPSVIVSQTLKDLGYPITDLQKRAEKLAKEAPTSAAKSDDNPYSYPSATLTTLLPQQERYGWQNPVFNENTLKEMLEMGVERLHTMRSGEGGWGWWAGQSPDLKMTAYVLNGLLLAKKAGVAVPSELIQHGANYLKDHYVQKTDLHLGIAIASALIKDSPLDGLKAYVRETLFPRRGKLSFYGRALLTLTLNTIDDKQRVATLLQEITAELEENEKRGRLFKQPANEWEWHNNDTETKAALLEVYSTLQPKSKWAERLVHELVDQRKSRIWDSTRDTALTVLALTHYIRATRELEQEYTLTANLNGTTKTLVITKENALLEKGEIAFGAEALKNGAQNLTLTKSGGGNCYYTAELRYFNDEEPLKPVRGEIGVERRYVRLTPNPDFKPTLTTEKENLFLTTHTAQLELQDDWTLEKSAIQSALLRTPLYDTTTLQSGDQLEVELYIESNNALEYVLFEDIKPAGCEAVDVNSGLKWDMERVGSYWWYGGSYYQELRDQKVASFVTYLPAGKSVIRYRLQVETPGHFRALPTNAYAMYVPKVNALSEERKINITDTAPQ
jgi:uncharacterized protein YfaS (alpha-2-macroglobulin family)